MKLQKIYFFREKNRLFPDNTLPPYIFMIKRELHCYALTAFLCLMSFSFVTSWTDRRKQQSEKVNLTVLFDKYVPPCLEVCRSRFRKITPIADIAHIHMLCHLLDCLLTPASTPADCPKEWYEIYFVFACVWAFGSALCQDQVCIHLECVSFLTCYCVYSLCIWSLLTL